MAENNFTEINEGWKRALEAKLSGYLSKAAFEDGVLNFFDLRKFFDPVEEQVYEAKRDFLKPHDVFSIFHDQFLKTVPLDVYRNSTGMFDAVVNEVLKAKIIANFVDFICSIPRKYSLFVRVPQLLKENCGTLRLSEKISAIEVHPDPSIAEIDKYLWTEKKQWHEEYRSLGEFTKGPKERYGLPPGYYFRIDVEGYSDAHLSSPATSVAVSLAKQFVYFLYNQRKVEFKTNYSFWGGIPEGSIYLFDHLEKLGPKILDVPENLRLFLGKIKLRGKEPELNSLSELKQLFADIAAKRANYDFHLSLDAKVLGILEANSDNTNATPIKNAVEWAFDSLMNEDDTKASFFQIAVALEAILGANSSHSNKTIQLATRCAYLIGRSVKEREEIRDMFENKFYKSRSALIHEGLVTQDTQKWLWWGQNIFDSIVRRELQLSKFEHPNG